MCDLGVSFTFHLCKKITESSVIFLRNGVLILHWKENKEAGAIYFQGKRTRNYYGKSHQKFMEVILLWKETKTFSGLLIIPNIITEKWGYSLFWWEKSIDFLLTTYQIVSTSVAKHMVKNRTPCTILLLWQILHRNCNFSFGNHLIKLWLPWDFWLME